MEPAKQWYTVYTRSRSEKKVAQHLLKKNIEHYCPLNRVVRQWSDRKKVILEPLFSSYVFVRIARNEQVQVQEIDGIINLVHWLGKPAVIREEEIESIKEFLKSYSNVKVNLHSVGIDDKVRVLNGPLMEQQGQIVGIKNKTVKVMLPCMGYMLHAELEMSNIEVVSN